MKKYKAVYVEITNVCNLHCDFCIGTKRKPSYISVEDFKIICEKVKMVTDYIYLHVMGEPLLHPELEKILKTAEESGLIVNITTNGTLISQNAEILAKAKALRKVSFSLHSFEGNSGKILLRHYLDDIWNFKLMSDVIVELRLWNNGGKNSLNAEIINYFSEKTGSNIDILPKINGERKIGEKFFLTEADKFEWPSIESRECKTVFCHGLRTHFAVLCDGTVVPCCLDSDGIMKLGNVLTEDIESILNSERAKNIVKGFGRGIATEMMCKHCGYGERFRK